MNALTASDLAQITTLIDGLLVCAAFSALILGAFFGWCLRGRYELWKWLKHGVYCDDCAPLVCSSKEHGGNQ